MRFTSLGCARPGSRALIALVAAGGLTAVALVAPADARPPIGPVKSLTVQVTKPTSAYHLAVDWADLTGATSYAVKLSTSSGTVLATDTVTASDWAVNTTRPAATVVRVTVTPMKSTRKGKPATVSTTLPDLTAPVGSFSVSPNMPAYQATITQDAISDDVTPAANIKREYRCDTGIDFADWQTGATQELCTYPNTGTTPERYVPGVRLSDTATPANSVTLNLDAVVFNDTTAPAGTYATVVPTKVWAKYTPVVLTESSLSDNLSPHNKISRLVNWGDGTLSPWTSGLTIKHVYAKGGTFTPQVGLTDEAGNTAVAPATPVTVLVDAVAPKVTLTAPKVGVHSVRSWVRLLGKATDAGVGMGKVNLRVIEKRGSVWYAYKPAKQVWVKAGTTAVSALKLAGYARVAPDSLHNWKLGVRGLRKGVLVVKYNGTDRVRNSSKVLTKKVTLTRS